MLYARAMLFALRIARRSWVRALVAFLAAAWLLGLSRLLAAHGLIAVTLNRRDAPPNGEHNLASFRYGPTIRASSYYRDPLAHHHPLFVVDERAEPTLQEKWTSSPGDEHPWIEVRWREPRRLGRVVIRHAGSRESDALTVRRYTIACLTESGAGRSVVVTDNESSVATHTLGCDFARGVRLDLHPERGDLARIYEIEAWGR
jgi:hypothetical protein